MSDPPPGLDPRPPQALTARYGKGRGPVWFDVHRVAQGGALLLTVVGAIVAIMGLKGGFINLGPHGKVGLTVLLAAAFQAVIGWFRPPKTGASGLGGVALDHLCAAGIGVGARHVATILRRSFS